MRKFSIPLIVLVVAGLVLSACSAAPAAPAAQAAATTAPAATSAPAAEPTMAMNATATPAAGAEPTAATEPTAASSGGMQHSPGMDSDESYDVHFIDTTIDHHTGVIVMAEQALKESQSVAVKDFAQKSMTNAQAEIDKLKAWRAEWHPNAAKMEDDMDMGAMAVSEDASKPFDQRFVEAMGSHHKGMIDMVNEGLSQIEHSELKQFAQDMIAGQQAEIAELQKLVQ